MDRTRNRLLVGTRIVAIGYVHPSTGEDEPHGTVEFLLKKGVQVRFDRGGDATLPAHQLVNEDRTARHS